MSPLTALAHRADDPGVTPGGDVAPPPGRLLSVAELQVALRAARAVRAARAGILPDTSVHVAAPAEVRGRGDGPGPAAVTPLPGPGAAGPGRGADVLVLAAHGGAGASTVALAVADAAADAGHAVRLVEYAEPSRSGLAAAATTELGVDPTGRWRRGTRGAVTVDRPATADMPVCLAVPWPTRRALVVLDSGQGRGDAPASAGGGAAAVVVVCRATVPGLRRAEQLLYRLGHTPVVVVAAVGPGRWPGPVAASTGPLLRELRAAGWLVAVPVDRRLEVTGPTSAALPKAVAAAGRALHALLDTDRPEYPGPVPAPAVPQPKGTHP